MKKKAKTKNNKKQLSTIIILLVVVVIGMTIAYAALSATLNISISKITQSTLSWDVGFQGTSATATVGGSGADGRSCGTATITSSTVTVADSALSKPDDSCTYKLTIANTGAIDATLAEITPVAPSSTSCTNSGASMVCGNITYKLTTDSTGNTLLTTGGTLAKTTGTRDVYLVIKYTGTSVNTSAVTQSGGGFTIVYNQA